MTSGNPPKRALNEARGPIHRSNPPKRAPSGARGLIHRLRAPDSGVLGQGVRFALTGCIVAMVYLLTTTVLAVLLGVPFQVALASGTCLALAVHFTLQRAF